MPVELSMGAPGRRLHRAGPSARVKPVGGIAAGSGGTGTQARRRRFQATSNSGLGWGSSQLPHFQISPPTNSGRVFSRLCEPLLTPPAAFTAAVRPDLAAPTPGLLSTGYSRHTHLLQLTSHSPGPTTSGPRRFALWWYITLKSSHCSQRVVWSTGALQHRAGEFIIAAGIRIARRFPATAWRVMA